MTTTFDPAHKGPNITLSNGNLTATVGAGSAGDDVTFSTGAVTTGKRYFELAVDVKGTGEWSIGICSASHTLTAFLGSDTHSVGYYGSGNVYVNGSAVTSIASFVVTNTVRCSVDLGGHLIWFAVGSGNWNNNASADPATGTLGISISALAADTFGGAFGGGIADKTTAAFDSGSWAFAAPSGFTAFITAATGGLLLTNRGMSTGMDRGSGSIRG